MPLTSVKRTQQLFTCLSALRRCQQDLEPEGIIEQHHFRRVHQNSFARKLDARLVVSARHAADTTAAFRADTTAECCRAHVAD